MSVFWVRFHESPFTIFVDSGYDAVGIAEETVKNFVYQLMPQSRQLQPSQAQVNFEKQQKRASFLAKRRRRDD